MSPVYWVAKRSRGPHLVEGSEDLHDLQSHLGIQIPCGFIGENQGWEIDESPGDGYSLLFPGGEGKDGVFLPFFKPNSTQTSLRLYFSPPLEG